MTITLLVMASPDDAPTPTQALLQPGSLGPDWTVLAGGDCSQLTHQFNAHAPNQVVLLGTASVVADSFSAWNGTPPCAVSWVGARPSQDELSRLLDLGLSGWWPDTVLLSAEDLANGLTLDRLRWERHAALTQELGQVQGQLSDRKYLDRAKGVLAQARGLDEDEAFKLLRGAAMHAKLKIGDVSRSVIEAAAWAEALNRAGQLRMLSQRVVKLAAQRLAGLDAHRARKLQEDSEQRAQANLDFLSALPQLGAQGEALPEALARTRAAWSVLQTTLAQRKSATVSPTQADEKANALLMQAEALVSELETAAGRRALTVVNLCGRQRMLAQRLAKDALLAEMLDDGARREGFAQLKSEFETALLELEMAPLSSPEIRDALKAAREEWTRLLSGLRFLDKSESRLAISRASEVLLEVFEGLTALYERSLQVIMS